jgi:hypothetical protein
MNHTDFDKNYVHAKSFEIFKYLLFSANMLKFTWESRTHFQEVSLECTIIRILFELFSWAD